MLGNLDSRRRGGLKAGLANVQNNRAAGLGIFAAGVQRRAAQLMLHQRWHLKRCQMNPACWYCRNSSEKT